MDPPGKNSGGLAGPAVCGRRRRRIHSDDVTSDRREIMKNLKSLCVYCGSAPGDAPVYLDVATRIGRAAAARKVRIVYGGGTMGLMGATAQTARDAGGKVFGVIPEFLMAKEGLLDNIDHKIVETMHERKMIMFEEADAFAVLPGGIGTLEEAIETLSWARLELHRKPIVLVNTNGFWSPLIELLDHITQRKFAPPWFRDCLSLVDEPEDAFDVAERALAAKVARSA